MTCEIVCAMCLHHVAAHWFDEGCMAPGCLCIEFTREDIDD